MATSKFTIKNKYRPTYEDTRKHFKLRLKERYNIEITDSEYDEYVKYISTPGPISESKAQFLYEINSNTTFWNICIKNTWVLVIYKRSNTHGDKVLRTALSISDKRMPVPNILKSVYSYEQFENKINENIARSWKLLPVLAEMGEKSFFRDYNDDAGIKMGTKAFNIKGFPNINLIVRGMIYKQKLNWLKKQKCNSNKRNINLTTI